jgi:hypothetical protein
MSIVGVVDELGLRSQRVESRNEAQDVLSSKEKWRNCVAVIIDAALVESETAGRDLARWIREAEAGRADPRRKILVGITAHAHRLRHIREESLFDLVLLSPCAPARLLGHLTSLLKGEGS